MTSTTFAAIVSHPTFVAWCPDCQTNRDVAPTRAPLDSWPSRFCWECGGRVPAAGYYVVPDGQRVSGTFEFDT